MINDIDPVGLIGGGAPENEYEGEVSMVVSVQKNMKDHDQNWLEEKIREIFQASFGETMRHNESFNVIAKKLILDPHLSD